jgi:hypothetical protein
MLASKTLLEIHEMSPEYGTSNARPEISLEPHAASTAIKHLS